MNDLDDLIAEANAVSTNDVVANPRRYRNLIGRLADALEAATRERDAAEARLAALTTPQEGDAREVTLERSFARWRDQEIDLTGALPEGYGMFRAGWQRAIAAIGGEHDHIDDGANYLDCAACEFATAGQSGLEAVIGVLMGLPVNVRRDTTELGRAIVATFPVLSRTAAPEPDAVAARALEEAADEIVVFPKQELMDGFDQGADAVYNALRARAAEIRERKSE